MTQTLTTERLKELADPNMICKCSWDEYKSMAAELLANREAQPLGYIDPGNLKTYRGVMAGGSWSPVKRTLSGLNLTLPIYLSAPPAPAVPDEMTGDGLLAMHDCGYIEGWNACRAAMLAQPVSQGYKSDGGWISCSDRLPESGQNIITLNNCGGVFGGYIFKKCTDGSYVFVDAEEEYREDDTITHWMALPAAPGVVK